MKADKIPQIRACLESGRYKLIDGTAHVYKPGRDSWAPVCESTLPNGYKQTRIFNFKRREAGVNVNLYLHILNYILAFGFYDPKLEIDHIDRDVSNNNPNNLRAVPCIVNQSNKDNRSSGYAIRPIRAEEIKKIRAYHALGYNQSEIAVLINAHRLTVRYTIKKIESGEPLMFENYEVKTPSNMFRL